MTKTLHRVSVTINQQQAELLDRLIADGELGGTYAEVIKRGFLRYCSEHQEAMEPKAAPPFERCSTNVPAGNAGPTTSSREESARP